MPALRAAGPPDVEECEAGRQALCVWGTHRFRQPRGGDSHQHVDRRDVLVELGADPVGTGNLHQNGPLRINDREIGNAVQVALRRTLVAQDD
jgi:hypothetical protein